VAIKVGELTAFINGDNSDLKKKLSDSEGEMNSTATRLGNAGAKAALAIGVGTAAVVGTSLKLFSDFEEGSFKVKTIMDESVVSFKDMKASSLDLSSQIGIDATEINESLYQVISATGDTANAIEMVEIAAKAGIGGFTDTAVAVDGLTSVMNSYGRTGADAMEEISDQMLIAQNVGKTTFGEMASSIGKVSPLTNALNVDTKDLFSSIAVLTKNGIQTSQAITGLKAAYSGILKPQENARKEAERLGLEFTAARLSQVGWAQFLDEISLATGGNAESMAQLFGSVEGLNSMMVLVSEQGAKDFDDAMIKMQNSAGATQSAFETMDQGLGDTLGDLKVKMENVGIKIGESAAPYIEDLVGMLDEVVTEFNNLSDAEKEAKIEQAAFVTGGTMLLLMLPKIWAGLKTGAIIVGTLASGIGTLGTAIAGVSAAPLLAVAGALAAIGASAWVIPKLIDDIKLMNDEEGWQSMDEYMDNPFQWKEQQRDVDEWKRYGKAMERMYPSTPFDNYPAPRYPGAPGQGGTDGVGGGGGDTYQIDIHDNTISDTFEIEEIGNKIVNRLHLSGATNK